MKPPPAVKFPGWKDSDETTTMASSGTAVFHSTTITLLSDMNLAPARLIAVNTIIARTATIRPRVLSSPLLSPSAEIIGKFSFTAATLLT